MNILWLSHLVPYPPTGLGVLQRSYNLIRELSRAHPVYLLAFIQKKLLIGHSLVIVPGGNHGAFKTYLGD